MDVSFREKSIAGSLIVTTGLFGLYFFKIFEVVTVNSLERLKELPRVLLGVVVIVVLVEIIYHAAIALGSGAADETDERDSLIEAKATRIAYFVLAAGCVTTIGHATLAGVFADGVKNPTMASPITTTNLVPTPFTPGSLAALEVSMFNIFACGSGLRNTLP